MNKLADRFRGYYPVIVDVETGGFNPDTDALLEIAAVTLSMDKTGTLHIADALEFAVTPFHNARLDEAALAFTGIDPFDPQRDAISETEALKELFAFIREEKNQAACPRAILVGQNACFDLSFVNAAIKRTNIKRNPFHAFSVLDTATLSALAFGQTTLPKALEAAKISFDEKQAHSAKYDAIKTAELFCAIINRWKSLGGWPLS